MDAVLSFFLASGIIGFPPPSPTAEHPSPSAVAAMTPGTAEDVAGPGHPLSPATPPPARTTPLGSPLNRMVAVLIASEYPAHLQEGHRPAYWYDTVLAYCALKRRGFRDQDIYVLYGDGEDGIGRRQPWGSTGYELPAYCGDPRLNDPIVDYPMTVPVTFNGLAQPACGTYEGVWRCAPKAIFRCLAEGCKEPRKEFGCRECPPQPIPALAANDLLVVWWRGHGRFDATSGAEAALNVGLDWLPSHTLATWINEIEAKTRILIFESCKSGCLTRAFGRDTLGADSGHSTSVVTACQCHPEAQVLATHDRHHAVFSFWLAGTVRGELPPLSKNPPYPGQAPIDLSHRCLASAFAEASQGTIQEVGQTAGGPIQEPSLIDSKGLALTHCPP